MDGTGLVPATHHPDPLQAWPGMTDARGNTRKHCGGPCWAWKAACGCTCCSMAIPYPLNGPNDGAGGANGEKVATTLGITMAHDGPVPELTDPLTPP